MLHSIQNLIDQPLEFRDGRAFLRDLYFEAETGLVRLVAVETGHPDRFEALVDATRLSTPVRSDGAWTLTVTDSELKDAPNWPEAVERGWLDPARWPLIIMGPFGGPLAPALALAGASVTRGQDPEAETASQEAERLVAPLERTGAWLGGSVFGWDGELGVLADLHFEPATRTFREMSLRVPGQKEPLTLPYDRLRHRAENGGHIVVDADHAHVTATS